MASNGYMAGRKKWYRPQAMLWSDSPGILSSGVYVPSGYEEYSDQTGLTAAQMADSFLILSDHNRSPISVSPLRIENKKRMINGVQRSHHVADKLQISTSWESLPSRGFYGRANFDQSLGISAYTDTSGEYTVDGGAGGSEMLEWYESHTGPFWVFLSYDKYTNFGQDTSAHLHLAEYSQVVQMYLTLDYSVIRRGQHNHDLWNVSVNLEEV